MTLRCLLCLSLLFQFAFAQKSDSSTGPEILERFIGEWELISGSLVSRPPANEVDSVKLTMKCEAGNDRYSVYCYYTGAKTVQGIEIQSGGQELIVYEPKTQLVYKLGGLRNWADTQDLDIMYVTIGKGQVTELGRLAFTEYLAGDEGPAGTHIYLWGGKEFRQFKEMSIYYDAEGEEVRRTVWDMRKVNETIDP